MEGDLTRVVNTQDGIRCCITEVHTEAYAILLARSPLFPPHTHIQ